MTQEAGDRDGAVARSSAGLGDRVLDYYRRPTEMTEVGRHANLVGTLPDDVAALAEVLQGLVIHEHIAPAYGVTLSAEQRASVHVRPAERLLDLIVARDERPLTVARAAERRLAGNCRHFTVLLTAFLRAKGVPARARCGFGGYFGTGWFEDHWVCEYWDAARGRWALADAQIDAVQRGFFEVDFDLMDVPRDRFLTGGAAWARCRDGGDDPNRFGLSQANESGLWWIGANLVRDAAALNNVEMLPWDVWGAMPGPGERIDDELTALYDRLATLTAAPGPDFDEDARFDELRAFYGGEQRVAVPRTVRNAVLRRDEQV